MTSSTSHPSPRDGFDEGSIAELAQGSREIEVEVAQPRPRVASKSGPVEVPDDASVMIDGLAAYGS